MRGVHDRGQRIPELVRKDREELGLAPIGVTQRLRCPMLLGDVHECSDRTGHLPARRPQRSSAAHQMARRLRIDDQVDLGIANLAAGGDGSLDGDLLQRNPALPSRASARGERFAPGEAENRSVAYRFPETRRPPSRAVNTAAGTVSSTVASSSSVERAPYCLCRARTAARTALTRVRISSGRSSSVTFPRADSVSRGGSPPPPRPVRSTTGRSDQGSWA